MAKTFLQLFARLRDAKKALPPAAPTVSRNQIAEWLEERTPEQIEVTDEAVRAFLRDHTWPAERIQDYEVRVELHLRLECARDLCFLYLDQSIPQPDDLMLETMLLRWWRRDAIAWARGKFEEP